MQSDAPFVLFGTAHLLTILAIVVVSIVLPVAIRRAGPGRLERTVAWAVASLLVIHECYKVWMRIAVYQQSVAESLPLHLCNVAAFLVAFILVRRDFATFEIAYFWGLAGTAQAVLTPDLPLAFPSLLYVTFFIGHGFIIVGVIYAIVVFGFQPTLRSVSKTILATLAYVALMVPVNFLLGTNYLYLRHKPAGATIIDYLGPWPWYILALIGAGILLCLLCYAPFAVRERLAGRS